MTANLHIGERDGAITFDVLVQPRASREKLGPIVGDRLKVALTAPPVDGEANAALITLVARALGVAKSAVSILSGESGRRKTLRVAGASAAALHRVLA